jgi:hypothetical protein
MTDLAVHRTTLINAFGVDFVPEFGELFAAFEGGVGVRVMPTEAGVRVCIWQDGSGCLPVADVAGATPNLVELVRRALDEVSLRMP